MSKSTCTFPDCGKPLQAKALCHGHYIQQWKGQPLRPLRVLSHDPPEERLIFGLSDYGVAGKCWGWKRAISSNGYGAIGVDGGLKGTHVLAYELWVGPVPEGLHVLHHCDNPPCCNPEHLRVGTREDNMQDMVSRGRSRNGREARTHCPQGHPLSGDNLYVYPNGRRNCQECRRRWKREYRARKA